MMFVPAAAREIENTFQSSGLHGQQFQHTHKAYAVAVYRENGRKVTHFERNTWVSHAEKEMIKHLEDVLEDERLRSEVIRLYVNFSPCFECSRLIIDFLERAEQFYETDLSLEIIFSHLYKIRRPSCVDGSHSKNHQLPDVTSHNRNLQGLRRLSVWGVDLRPFTEKDWQKFAALLSLPFRRSEYCNSGRDDEDEALLEDFDALNI